MTEFETKLVHGIPQNDNQTGAVNVPVYNSSTYIFPKVAAKIRWDYARSGNPTRNYLEDQLAALEGGAQGFAFSSGLAAIHAVLSIFSPGDHLVIGNTIYGGTFRLINQFFKRWQLEFTAVDTQDPRQVEAAVQENTKAIYFETFTNPLLKVTSVKQIAQLARKHNLLTIVDNTFLTPYLQQPLALGADIVIHSATKYLGGHSDTVAGIAVAKSATLAQQIYFNQNGIGAVLSPENANLIRRGIQTLALRMEKHTSNAAKVVSFLQKQAQVTHVYYPGIPGTRDYEIATAEAKGYGGVLSFELRQDLDAQRFVEKLKLIKLAVSLGAVESLIELPAKMTHAELSPKEQLAVGITPQLVRLAVGIEDPRDLIADLAQALGE
ncbi:trans-sulfuration enzyme family protein [Liquorilactobacillus satsumensis]|uniref:Cystathionine gamma-synthase n=1 Tax=Liquorilactobacillus satsumensis DSM 16230 = JCM 12392 TaxID=1423801 RepID=A0A0R1V5V9_9LACO|nr:PLP-dependent aspartate aminotransferase family protein [Liquorilactobacillus satsumensis]KRL97099.1 cystathionine gamma-synthase [Liquorilactobacillus satsumensis DSM 16230 = JCM 12392]MCC7666800.1 PLP-dependent transferase [Liquorilactobacillus satsumensis]MCP9312000.1 PLP-dependent transferase [Liquorilactobacillus satsumensis]MCP9328526.1 PLP-dependent transferase [Liquorilactobacillus satsumensis]MCP9358383.1 PLP-dependent transferase [Liquorilactobacillus satsumensis]